MKKFLKNLWWKTCFSIFPQCERMYQIKFFCKRCRSNQKQYRPFQKICAGCEGEIYRIKHERKCDQCGEKHQEFYLHEVKSNKSEWGNRSLCLICYNHYTALRQIN